MKFELKPFNRNVPDSELLADLVSAHEKLNSEGKSLTFRSYKAVGRYRFFTIMKDAKRGRRVDLFTGSTACADIE